MLNGNPLDMIQSIVGQRLSTNLSSIPAAWCNATRSPNGSTRSGTTVSVAMN